MSNLTIYILLAVGWGLFIYFQIDDYYWHKQSGFKYKYSSLFLKISIGAIISLGGWLYLLSIKPSWDDSESLQIPERYQ